MNIRSPRDDDPIYTIERGPRLSSSAAIILVEIVIGVALICAFAKILDHFDNQEGVGVHVSHKIP